MGKLDANSPRVSATAPEISDCPDGERHSVSANMSWTSSILMVTVGGLALFSDGYNAQVVGYMNPVLTELYPEDYTSGMKTRMSNSFLIGEIFGMLFFGWAIDKLGRRNGIVFATAFLVLGIVLTTAAHGTTNTGMFWMMIIGRGIAGFGAGGLYPSQVYLQHRVTDKSSRRISDMCYYHDRGNQRQRICPRKAWSIVCGDNLRRSGCWVCCCGHRGADCSCGISAKSQRRCVAGKLWYRYYPAIRLALLPPPYDRLYAIFQTCHERSDSIHVDPEEILETDDRHYHGLVHVRLCGELRLYR